MGSTYNWFKARCAEHLRLSNPIEGGGQPRPEKRTSQFQFIEQDNNGNIGWSHLTWKTHSNMTSDIWIWHSLCAVASSATSQTDARPIQYCGGNVQWRHRSCCRIVTGKSNWSVPWRCDNHYMSATACHLPLVLVMIFLKKRLAPL